MSGSYELIPALETETGFGVNNDSNAWMLSFSDKYSHLCYYYPSNQSHHFENLSLEVNLGIKEIT